MKNIDKIIKLNRLADEAIRDKNYEYAWKCLRSLHKMEIMERAGLGAYRLKGA